MIVIFGAFGLAACLLNKRQNIVFIAITFLVFIAISVLFHFGLLDNLAINQYRESWYIVAISTQGMAILFMLIINIIFNNINDQLTEIEKTSKIIKAKNMALADANIKMQQLFADIKKEQNLINSIFDSIPGYLYVYDENERLIKWNKKHETMTGFTAEELSSMTLEKWFDQEDIVKVRAAVRDVFEKGFGEVEAQLILKNGQTMMTHSSGAPLILDGKKYFAGIGIDVTERKQMEAEIEHRAMQNRTMMETTQDGFCAVDFTGQLTDVNQAYCKMTGYTKEELLGIKIGELDVLDSPQETAERIKGIIENGSALFETRHKKKDGSFLDIEVSATLVDQDEVIFVFCRNITERKKMEHEIRQSEERFQLLFNKAPLGYQSLDSEGCFIEVNQKWLDTLGYSKEEVIGKMVW